MKNHKELEDELFASTTTAELNDHVNILVNGRRIDVLEELETELKDADTVAIFPPVAGG